MIPLIKSSLSLAVTTLDIARTQNTLLSGSIGLAVTTLDIARTQNALLKNSTALAVAGYPLPPNYTAIAEAKKIPLGKVTYLK